MLKKNVQWLFYFVLMLSIIIGCRVASVQQFYCKENTVSFPLELSGQWLSDEFSLFLDKDKTVISSLKTKDKQNIIYPVFFKIDKTLFVDVSLGYNSEIEPLPKGYLLIPCHVLFRIYYSNNEFSATPLSAEWINDQVKRNLIEIPHVVVKNPTNEKESDFLFTASPEQWSHVLKNCATIPEAFKYKIVFKRVDAPAKKMK